MAALLLLRSSLGSVAATPFSVPILDRLKIDSCSVCVFFLTDSRSDYSSDGFFLLTRN